MSTLQVGIAKVNSDKPLRAWILGLSLDIPNSASLRVLALNKPLG